MQAMWVLLLFALRAPDPKATIDGALQRLAPDLPLADDASFLRRASIDLCGVVPDGREVEAFLEDVRPGKRAALVDALMARPCAAETFASFWSDVLLGPFEPAKERRIDRPAFRRWLARAWTEDLGWDESVTAMITAAGTPESSPPVSFILSRQSLEELNGDVARLFMGVGLQCAECHDHPEENIARRSFWEMAAFFARSRVKFDNMRPSIVDGVMGELSIPDGALVRPTFLTGEKPPRGDGHAQRAELAQLVTSAKTGWFGRATVDRLWAHYLGRGLVEPVDNLGLESCPDAGKVETQAELLCALARDFERGGRRIRPFVRALVLSKAYQASTTAPLPRGVSEFAVRRIMPMTPEALYASLIKTTGSENLPIPDKAKERALIGLSLLIGQDDDRSSARPAATVPLSLLLMNGPAIDRAVRPHPGGTVDRIWRKFDADRARIEGLFLAVLGRRPRAEELSSFLDLVAGAGRTPRPSRLLYSDMLWAMINSTEFFYNR